MVATDSASGPLSRGVCLKGGPWTGACLDAHAVLRRLRLQRLHAAGRRHEVRCARGLHAPRGGGSAAAPQLGRGATGLPSSALTAACASLSGTTPTALRSTADPSATDASCPCCLLLYLLSRTAPRVSACGKQLVTNTGVRRIGKALPMRVCGKVEQTTRRASPHTAAPARLAGCSWQCCHPLLRQTAQHYLPKTACLIDVCCKGQTSVALELAIYKYSSDYSSTCLRTQCLFLPDSWQHALASYPLGSTQTLG